MDSQPLAEILRPKTLDDVIGQEHLVGPNGVIRKLLSSGFIPSMILWGPPGSGKTTLAHLLASLSNSYFVPKSAVTTTLADVRLVVKEAKARKDTTSQRTVLFIDEIHRFNKAQQDAFLPHVENGTLIFIGATTENPSFEVISPLLSRSRVFVLKPLEESHLRAITQKGLTYLKQKINDDAMTFLHQLSNGDARALLTILEIAASLKSSSFPRRRESSDKDGFQHVGRNDNGLTIKDIEEVAQRKMLQYDQSGEEHYNTISAYIKSMRASNVDASLYYLARMVEAGEDPLFIARRMVIFASEDIGLAQPTALVVANAVFEACNKIGYPEAQINLAHGTAYLAQAKKDKSAYHAYFEALDDVKKHGNLPIPLNIRNAPTKFMKGLGYGKGYEAYTKESLLPDKIKGKRYYKVREVR